MQVRSHLRSRVTFQRINLVETLPINTLFPLIFCRNVMIYFNKNTQTDVVAKLAAKLEPGGYLFVGHSESLSGFRSLIEICQTRRVPEACVRMTTVIGVRNAPCPPIQATRLQHTRWVRA